MVPFVIVKTYICTSTANQLCRGKYQSKLGVGANREGVKVSGSKAGVAIASSSSLSEMTGLLLKAGLVFGGGWRGWRPFNSGSRYIPQWRMFLVRSLFRDVSSPRIVFAGDRTDINLGLLSTN
jgi:hypothetical protein